MSFFDVIFGAPYRRIKVNAGRAIAPVGLPVDSPMPRSLIIRGPSGNYLDPENYFVASVCGHSLNRYKPQILDGSELIIQRLTHNEFLQLPGGSLLVGYWAIRPDCASADSPYRFRVLKKVLLDGKLELEKYLGSTEGDLDSIETIRPTSDFVGVAIAPFVS